jgi:hypothetical protein
VHKFELQTGNTYKITSDIYSIFPEQDGQRILPSNSQFTSEINQEKTVLMQNGTIIANLLPCYNMTATTAFANYIGQAYGGLHSLGWGSPVTEHIYKAQCGTPVYIEINKTLPLTVQAYTNNALRIANDLAVGATTLYVPNISTGECKQYSGSNATSNTYTNVTWGTYTTYSGNTVMSRYQTEKTLDVTSAYIGRAFIGGHDYRCEVQDNYNRSNSLVIGAVLNGSSSVVSETWVNQCTTFEDRVQ